MNDNTVMTENTEPEAENSVTLERPARHIRQPFVHRNLRLILLCIAAMFGAAAGAFFAPDNAVCVLTRRGGFAECFLARLVCSGSVLALEYAAGFFAAGGFFVWIAPLFSGLGAGLSVACAAGSGAPNFALIAIAAAYPLITAFAANTSANLSELIAHFISSKKSSIIMSESAVRGYTLSFIFYLMILLAFSAAEAALKL